MDRPLAVVIYAKCALCSAKAAPFLLFLVRLTSVTCAIGTRTAILGGNCMWISAFIQCCVRVCVVENEGINNARPSVVSLLTSLLYSMDSYLSHQSTEGPFMLFVGSNSTSNLCLLAWSVRNSARMHPNDTWGFFDKPAGWVASHARCGNGLYNAAQRSPWYKVRHRC